MPLRLIEKGLNEPCEMISNPYESSLTGCTALLLDNSRLMLMENHPHKAFLFAIDALKLDSLISNNATLHNYKNILFLNRIARSYMWNLIQMYNSTPYQFGPYKRIFSRADISHYLTLMEQYLLQRTPIKVVMQDMEERDDIKLSNLMQRYFTPDALWKIKLQREGNLSLYDRFNIYREVMENSRQSIIDRYNRAINQSISLLTGQYTRQAMKPLHVWQSWLQHKSVMLATKLPPPLHLDVDDHADLAYDHLLITSLAIILYQYDNRNYPQNLQQLVPKYLPYVPSDPFAVSKHSPLLYSIPPNSQTANPYLQRVPGEPYSIGPDGKDDGGIPYQIFRSQFLTPQPAFVPLNDYTKGDLVAMYEVYSQ